MRNKNLVYATKNGELIHISQVKSGVECNCFCPFCESRVVSKKGDFKSHHFAHYNADECKYGYETSINLAAKSILAKCKRIKLPSLFLMFDSNKRKELIDNERYIEIEKNHIEKRIDKIISDITIESQGEIFLLELFVTHRIDGKKKR